MNIKTIGIVGGGQLGMMIAIEAKKLEYKVAILDPNENCSAKGIADIFFAYDYSNIEGIKKLNKISDIVTYEFENVDENILYEYIDSKKLVQGIKSLQISKNRKKEKNFLNSINVPTTNFMTINTFDDFKKAIKTYDYKCVLKTCVDGYDGKGQCVINSKNYDEKEIVSLIENGECILEKLVNINKEASVIIARNVSGDIVYLPIAENINESGILSKSIVPARLNNEIQDKILMYAKLIAKEIELVGVMGVEFFIDENNNILVNELAPRVHNSGHYSLDGCSINQFYLHLLALMDVSLKQENIFVTTPCVMVNCLGQHYEKAKLECLKHLNWHPYFYKKDKCKFNRKMGHINIVGTDIESILLEVDNTNIWK